MAELRIYNELARKKEVFQPLNPGKVGMYVCGPTVYDHCHIGHGRGYVAMDILRKYLEYLGFEVRYIMNYTDVGHLTDNADQGEDKIEKKARKEKLDPMEITDKYILSCKEDFEALNIKPPTFTPRPTRYIDQIIRFVQSLVEKGYAYESGGSVYFSVEKFPGYGKLSGRKTDELLEGARVEINPEKKNPLDFALWIKAPKGHLLKWESPWGIGYPGWHIECSVMSCDLLGQDTFDIHGGGNENIFPHNENEVAQSEAYLGKKMAGYWVLWNMVNIDGQKMSKSLGNSVLAKDAIAEYGSSAVRLWIISSHYRSVINYAKSSLDQAKANLRKISDFVFNLEAITTHPEKAAPKNVDFGRFLEKFEMAMGDDLNTPVALSALYEMITETNSLIARKEITPGIAGKILSVWKKINSVLGLELEAQAKIPEEIRKMAEERETARREKNFSRADELRRHIEKRGYVVEDTTRGYSIKTK